MPLNSINPSLSFEIWVFGFVDPFPKRAKRTGEKYIITKFEYLTKWMRQNESYHALRK